METQTTTETPADLIAFLSGLGQKKVAIYFQHPSRTLPRADETPVVFITFHSKSESVPVRACPYHFRICLLHGNRYQNIQDILKRLSVECSDLNLSIFLEWPSFSWIQKIKTGVTLSRLLKFVRQFPGLDFKIDKPQRIL